MFLIHSKTFYLSKSVNYKPKMEWENKLPNVWITSMRSFDDCLSHFALPWFSGSRTGTSFWTMSLILISSLFKLIISEKNAKFLSLSSNQTVKPKEIIKIFLISNISNHLKVNFFICFTYNKMLHVENSR